MKGRIDNKTLTTILMALVVAAIAVPGAGARSPQQPAVPASLAQIQHPGGVSDFDTYDFVQPTGVYEPVRQPTSVAATAAGFAWRDAAIGGIFMVGLGLLAVGVLLAVRRSRAVADGGLTEVKEREANARVTKKAFTWAQLLVGAFAVCLVVPFAGTAAGPADVVCSQDAELFTGTAHNLVVAQGSFCFVLDATITNDLIVSDFGSAVVLDTAIGRDLAANEDAGVEVGLGTTIGRDLVLRGPGGGVRLEETTIGRDLVASNPGTVQTGHNRPEAPGGPVFVGRDVVIDGSPDLEFVFDGICDLHVARDLRITNRSVTLGIGLGNICAPNGQPSNAIGRDLVFTGNHALDGFFGPSSLHVGDNHVGRDLVFSHNAAVAGGSLEVSGNAVVRDATCAENSPAVTVGASNTAGRANACG